MNNRLFIGILLLVTLSVSAYVHFAVDNPLGYSIGDTTVHIPNKHIGLGVLKMNHPESVIFTVENSGT